MRTVIRLLAILMFLAVSKGYAVAEDDDRAAVLNLIDRAFYAVGSGNPDDMRAIQLAEGTSISIRQHPDGSPGELLMRVSTNEALLQSESSSDDRFVERWTGDPTVMTHGPIAVVWGEYEFWINGKFSHCGVDTVDLVKVDGEWKIANWTWTVEKDNCSNISPEAPE